jgi:hypothetical protein
MWEFQEFMLSLTTGNGLTVAKNELN